MDGLALVDKPAGPTSHDVVARCRRIFGQRRVGHAGTLDPDATGLLLVGVGRATRLLTFLSGLSKVYEGEVVLGVATTTLDASGEVTGRWDMSSVTVEDARAAAVGLTGDILQIPPMVSALKVGGRRLHELARAGVEVERQPRPVRVERFEVDAADSDDLANGPVLRIRVACSSGTYIRTLAADLGEALGGGAHLRRLRRTAAGQFSVDQAVELEALSEMHVLAPGAAVGHLPSAVATGRLPLDVAQGKVLSKAELDVEGEGPWAVLNEEGALLAIYQAHSADTAKPAVVIAAANA